MKRITFGRLVQSICAVHQQLSVQTAKSINRNLTLRNWFIGMRIAEFELCGADRAEYGEKLFDELSGRLVRNKISGCSR